MTFDPPIPATPASKIQNAVPFIQTIRSEHATLIWFCPDAKSGVAYILSVEVDPKQRRKGHGTAIAKTMQAQAHLFFKRQQTRFRRTVVMANQKTHVNARAWLTRLGFHHIQTLTNVGKDEDILVYLLGMD